MNKSICHDNSWSVWHGNGYGNANMFGLGGIDLLLLIIAAAEQVQDLLLPIHAQTHCREHVRHAAAAAAQYSIHELLIAGGAGGGKLLQQTLTKYLGLFKMHWCCADRLAYDIEVPREQFESIRSCMLSNHFCGTLMSCADWLAQCQCISNKPLKNLSSKLSGC